MIFNEKIYDDIARNFFDTHIIKKNDTLIVALSGGMDSMCLLDIFYKLQSEFRYNLEAIHIHHGIRGIEADRDLRFVKKYCQSINIKIKVHKVDAPQFAENNKLSLEEGSRKLRYKIFKEEIDSLKSKGINAYILVAHHKNDQVETIIHNILRGSGTKGLIGMNYKNNYILRPLLDYSKKDIENYIKSYNIPYVTDSTNMDTNYTRNYIRIELVDKLYKINENAANHIIELSKNIKEMNDYVDAVSEYTYMHILKSQDDRSITLNLKNFKTLNHIIKIGVIKLVISNLTKTLKDITRTHFESIIELSDKQKGGHLDLPYNITLDKKQNNLTFSKNKHNISMSRRKNNGA